MLPKLHSEFIATSATNEQTWTPLTIDEKNNCITNSFCQVSHPSLSKSIDGCGVNSFYDKLENCDYIEQTDNLPQFFSINDITYYSIDKKSPLTLESECFSPDETNVNNEQITLVDTGNFTLKISCQLTTSNGMIIQPSTQHINLEAKDYDSKSISYINHNPNKITPLSAFRLLPTLIRLKTKDLYNKYILPLYVAIGTLSTFTLLIPIIIFIILRFCSTPTLLTLKKLWGGGIKTRPVQQLSLFSRTNLQL